MYKQDFKDCHMIMVNHNLDYMPIVVVQDEEGNYLPINHVIITHNYRHRSSINSFTVEFTDLTLFEEPKELIYSGTISCNGGKLIDNVPDNLIQKQRE